MENDFIKSRVLIGQGKMAKVYLYNGFAYKCFDETYPQEAIDYEISVQKLINESNINTVKYYESEIPHSIKMDYIDGISLADRVFQEKYRDSIDDLLVLISSVHKIEDIDLPKLNPYLSYTFEKMDIDQGIIERAAQFLSEIPDGRTLCHLDFHFLNLMYAKDDYYIIDWINAKTGNPIYDYARSYVILHEYAYRLSKKFLKRVKNLGGYLEDDFKKAVYVMAVHRLSEQESEKVRKLIDCIDADLKS